MTTNLNTTAPVGERPPWFRVAQFLFLLGLAVAVFLLGVSMVHHRFFSGGSLDRHGHFGR
jgi:hypothetical protein